MDIYKNIDRERKFKKSLTPQPPLLQRGGVLETVRLSNNERKYLRTTRGITDITPLPLEATLYTHLLGSYKRQLDVQKSVVLSLL